MRELLPGAQGPQRNNRPHNIGRADRARHAAPVDSIGTPGQARQQ